MCGIFGWLGDGVNPDIAVGLRDRLRHRGPDDVGYWQDDEARVWLGHRRLSIFDLSANGHQPMHSKSGRFVIIFNGEVYNFMELRLELEPKGHVFVGGSDTEVILAAIEEWGFESALSRFIGMFAFALWDRQSHELKLVRDRLGIKPLYYAHTGNRIAFASELRALRGIEWIDKALDPRALEAYFRYLCVPSPLSILKGVSKLEPGQYLMWSGCKVTLKQYWSLEDAVAGGAADPIKMSLGEATDAYEELLRDAVRLRMRSDVPYGSFLSGGVDSSLVTAIMCQESSQPTKTFTIGFAGSGNDESVHAKAVALHLGTDHYEEFADASTVPDLAREIAGLHDEPFADGSSLPTYLLTSFARKHVTIALGGDGGDETFGGYPRYFWAERIERWRRRLTNAGSGLMATGLKAMPAALLDGPVNYLLGNRYAGAHGFGARVHRFADYLRTSPAEADNRLNTAWPDPADLLLGGSASSPDRNAQWRSLNWAGQMMAIDQKHYLPDDILTKVDRMSMARALEVRVPLLDHRLVEWSWRVPEPYKFTNRDDRGKILMRNLLYRFVPKSLIERPKMGFGLPMEEMLRGPLRTWASEILSPAEISNAGLLNSEMVQNAWAAHQAGENRLNQVWTILMFQLWLARHYAKPEIVDL